MAKCDKRKPSEMNSMISSEYIDILACPVCKGRLLQKDTGKSLLCVPCGLIYPVTDGIPVMLPEEAEKNDDSLPEAGKL